jgi:hypothetical protein
MDKLVQSIHANIYKLHVINISYKATHFFTSPPFVPPLHFMERGIGGEVPKMLSYLSQKVSFSYQKLWQLNWRKPSFD